MENTQLQVLVNEFAKANKVSRAKVETLVSNIQALSPKKVSNGHKGRPVMEKTKALHDLIIQKAGVDGNDAVSIRKQCQVDNVAFNNAVSYLVKTGKLFRLGKFDTGLRGRQPYILSSVKPE